MEPRDERPEEKTDPVRNRRVAVPPVAKVPEEPRNEPEPEKEKKKKASKTTLIISIVIALLVCGVCFDMYKQAQDQREMEE